MELQINQVILHHNINKPKTEKRGSGQPEFIGTINVDGVVREIALWVKTSKKGQTYLLGNNKPPIKNNKPKQRTKPIVIKKDANNAPLAPFE